MNWYRIADRLGLTIDECQAKVSATGFLEWCEYLRQQDVRARKHELYTARLIAEVRRGYVKDPRTVKITDFIIEDKDLEEKPKPTTLQQATQVAKSFFLGAIMAPYKKQKRLEKKAKVK